MKQIECLTWDLNQKSAIYWDRHAQVSHILLIVFWCVLVFLAGWVSILGFFILMIDISRLCSSPNGNVQCYMASISSSVSSGVHGS